MADPNQKLNVYNLGEQGVNLSKSPLHIEDGELVNAQNAEFYLDEGIGAIRKRLGLQRLNTSALAGAVYGVAGIPLPAPGSRAIYAQLSNSPYLRKTTDGTTWANVTEIDQGNLPGEQSGSITTTAPYARTVTLDRNLYYVSQSATNGQLLYALDGELGYEVIRYPYSTDNHRTLCVWDDWVVFVAKGFVWLFSPYAGTIEQIGAEVTGLEIIACAVPYLGRLYVGTLKQGGSGRMLSARYGDTAWTVERTVGASHEGYVSVAVYKGNLYAGTGVAAAGTAAIIEKRTPGGTWSTSRTGASSANDNKWDPLLVADERLYATFTDGTTNLLTDSFNDTAWSSSIDWRAESPVIDQFFGGVVVNKAIYVAVKSAAGSTTTIWRKPTNATAWAQVDSLPTSGTTHSGFMGVI